MARRRRSRSEDPSPPRTFSIWLFALVFAVLAAVGLVGVLLGLGTGGSGPVQLEVPQTTSTTVLPTTVLPTTVSPSTVVGPPP